MINSTIGIGGFFNPAGSYFKIKEHNEDFGQTLGYWGVGSGYHIVLPFFGPSNMRDMFGFYPDSYLNPLVYHKNYDTIVDSDTQSFGVMALEKVNYESLHFGKYEELKKDAIELYPFLKHVYEEHRDKLINDEG